MTVGRVVRKIRWWGWLAVAIVVVGAAGGGFVGIEHSRVVALTSFSPQPGAYLATQSVSFSGSLPGYRLGRGQVTLTVDGREVPSANVSLAANGVTAKVKLADGEHTATLVYTSNNIFSRHLQASTRFAVDTVAPAISIDSPAPGASLGAAASQLQAHFSETVKSCALSIDGTPVGLTLKGTAAEAELTFKQGVHQLTLTATDLAGNTSTKQWQLLAEFASPTVSLGSWPGSKWTKASGAIDIAVIDPFPSGVEASASLDGQPLAMESATPWAVPGGSTAPAAETPLFYQVTTGDLAEGQHQLQIDTQNAGGHAATFTQTFLVDTGARLGQADLTVGATGSDVTQLQQILTARGFYTGKPSGVFDQATQEAVDAYEQARGLTPSSGLSKAVATDLLGLIVIDRSARTLSLFQDGKLVKTYPVAVGQPAYPTPTGHFRIISKVVNPTWTPPNSPWAKGAKPIGPGPNDPLGTRWMGISSPGVGIHGTNEPSSIGYDASHGCIRMLIPEAEDLFTRVYIGTPVNIIN